MRKKIAFILGSMGKGGAERVISILSKYYADKEWDTNICVLLSNDLEYTLDKSTKFWDFSGNTESRIKRIPLWLKSIRHFVKDNKIDVVVSFAARINVLVMMACAGLNVRIVVSERNDPQYDGRGFITKALTSILYPKAECVVFQTERVKSFFSKRIQKNSKIIPNPIIVNAYRVNPDRNKIVTVGSLKEQKNQQLLIDAMSDVLLDHPTAKLTIYGEGPLRGSLEKQIAELCIEKSVLLPGQKNDIHEEIKNALFFVLSSDYEGLSNALLEAMMMGIPCISTDCAGSDEYIENQINGLLVPVKNKAALVELVVS